MIVKVTASSIERGSDAGNLLDLEPSELWTSDVPSSWFQIDFLRFHPLLHVFFRFPKLPFQLVGHPEGLHLTPRRQLHWRQPPQLGFARLCGRGELDSPEKVRFSSSLSPPFLISFQASARRGPQGEIHVPHLEDQTPRRRAAVANLSHHSNWPQLFESQLPRPLGLRALRRAVGDRRLDVTYELELTPKSKVKS